MSAYTCATVFGLGLVPVAPGTAASAAAAGLYIAVGRWVVQSTVGFAAVIVVTTVLGTLAARLVASAEGVADPSKVVIDEVAGQWLTFLGLPCSWWIVLAGFLLFRLFDIWKPFPIRLSERLGKGVGIMADDLLAGLYANVILRGLLVVPVLSGWLGGPR